MRRLAILSLFLAMPAAADTLPGYDRFAVEADHRTDGIAASVWYPAGTDGEPTAVGRGPIFEPVSARMGADVADGSYPLVLLSHGSGGNADGLGWLSAALVADGAVVLAVDHPGSTTGDSSPRRAIDLAARAADLSAALDVLLADPVFADRIDRDRIGAVGFSLGGTTALGLAGLRFDAAAQDARCATLPDAADCGFFLRDGGTFADEPGFEGDAKDPRIARVVAVDPGFGHSVEAASLPAVDVPVALVNLGDTHRLPAVDVGPDGNGLAQRLSGAAYTVVAPATHFTFLAPCRAGAAEILAEEGEDPICTDPDGVDRRAVHAALVDIVARGLGLDRQD